MKPYYSEPGIEIYHGDCRDILPHLPRCSLCLTDPPYGINHKTSHGASWMNTAISGDSDTTLRDGVLGYFDDVAAFGTWKTPPIMGTRGVLVWNKGPAFGMGDLAFPWKPSWELIYIKGSRWHGTRDEGVLIGPVVVSWESKGRRHPHEKPQWIFEYLIGKHPGQVIVDPFMGSGPSAAACKAKGRDFVGIEIEKKYCDIAIDRLRQEVLPLNQPTQEKQEQGELC